MSTRPVFSNLKNNAISQNVAGKRMSRATNILTKEVSSLKINHQIQGKENVIASMKESTKPVTKPVRSTRVAARRLSKPKLPVVTEEKKMKVETIVPKDQALSLPEGVLDIDAADSANPQLCAEYATEIYAYLRLLETREGYKMEEEHLVGCPINSKMRAVLVDWLVDVQMQFKLLPETLFLTISFIDRYLVAEGNSLHRTQLQLVGVAAMFLAAKVEEIFAPEISDFVYITDDAYTSKEIRRMELKMINTLHFDLCPPIALNFLRRCSKAGGVDILQHSMAKFILEQSLLDYTLVSTPPSHMAAAALHLSLLLTEEDEEITDVNSVWNINLKHYSSYSSSQLMPTVRKLANMVDKAEKNTKLQAVRTKYSSTKFMSVAKLPQLKGRMMSKLCNKQK